MGVVLVDGKRVMEVSGTKAPGVIDNKLNWKPHIRYVRTKVAKGMHYIEGYKYSIIKHYPICIIPLYIHT